MCQLNSQPNGTCSSYFITRYSCHDVTCVNNLFPIYSIFVTCFVDISKSDIDSSPILFFMCVMNSLQIFIRVTIRIQYFIFLVSFWAPSGQQRLTSRYSFKGVCPSWHTLLFQHTKVYTRLLSCSCYGTKFKVHNISCIVSYFVFLVLFFHQAWPEFSSGFSCFSKAGPVQIA